MTSFIINRSTGYGTQAKNIKTVHLWSDIFGTSKEIFYYGTYNKSSSAYVVDLEMATEGRIMVNLYPGASVTIVEEMEKVKGKIFELFAQLSKDYPDKKCFAVDVEKLEEVTEESFKRYSLDTRNGFELFIFRDFEGGNRLVSQVYLLETKNTQEFIETNSAQTWASHWVFPPVGKATETGKYLTFLLLKSTVSGKVEKKCEYALRNTHLPSLPTTEIPSFYNTTALDKLAESSGANKIVRIGGTYVDKGNTPEVVDDYSSVFTDEPGMKAIEDKMCRDIINKGAINYSDMLCFGVPETLRLIQSDRIVHVNMDIIGLAQKAVIFAGFVYAIPWKDTATDKENLSTDLGEYFVESNHDSIPNNSLVLIN